MLKASSRKIQIYLLKKGLRNTAPGQQSYLIVGWQYFTLVP